MVEPGTTGMVMAHGGSAGTMIGTSLVCLGSQVRIPRVASPALTATSLAPVQGPLKVWVTYFRRSKGNACRKAKEL